eukprot:CAMPEP_0119318540 /NCGR_PEP_ID=MMETSP1333-20130426/46733_1 /TAXON_ID=418940 /ORGANISM="Scyphosphaera apsteinii, Strain RCC1455" /LENGTH=184 /DNA_ID=CAMNT_0007324741 /DNA_START=83 /DNA_END=634 /DNA_ORIENTATION=+
MTDNPKSPSSIKYLAAQFGSQAGDSGVEPASSRVSNGAPPAVPPVKATTPPTNAAPAPNSALKSADLPSSSPSSTGWSQARAGSLVHKKGSIACEMGLPCTVTLQEVAASAVTHGLADCGLNTREELTQPTLCCLGDKSRADMRYATSASTRHALPSTRTTREWEWFCVRGGGNGGGGGRGGRG